MADTIELRRITSDDWRLLRTVRLRALQADPSAFGSTFQREVAFAEDVWRGRTGSAATVLAIDATGAPVGMGSVRQLEQGTVPAGEINQMWVDPVIRGAGLGRKLLDALLAQARTDGYQQAWLWVTTGNDAAIGLYERAGFVQTGRSEPLRSDSQLTMLEYVLALA